MSIGVCMFRHIMHATLYFLFSNFQVLTVLVGNRPHTFSNYESLDQFWTTQVIHDCSFDVTTIFSILKDKGYDDFHHVLTELLWFGDVRPKWTSQEYMTNPSKCVLICERTPYTDVTRILNKLIQCLCYRYYCIL